MAASADQPDRTIPEPTRPALRFGLSGKLLLLTIPLTHLVNYIDTRLRRGRATADEDPLEPSTTSQEMV